MRSRGYPVVCEVPAPEPRADVRKAFDEKHDPYTTAKSRPASRSRARALPTFETKWTPAAGAPRAGCAGTTGNPKNQEARMGIRTHDVISMNDERVKLAFDSGTGQFSIVVDGVTVFRASNSPVIAVPDGTSYSVFAVNSGKRHILPNLTGSCSLLLPAPAVGLEFEFIYGGVASDAQNWVLNSQSDTNYFAGGVMFCDHDSADAEIAPVAGDGNSNSKLTVVTPAVGTRLLVSCADGVLWTLSGFINSATIPTFADQ